MNKLLRLIVSGGLLAWLGWRTDWSQVSEAFANLHLGPWLAALGLYLGAQVISSLRWQHLARPLGFEGPLARFTGYCFIGMYFNLMLPTSVGGDVVRAWYLDNRPGRRMDAFLSVLIDRLIGLLALLALACVAVAACPIELPVWIRVSVWACGAAAALGLAALPVLVRWTNRFGRVRRLAERGRLYLAHPWLLLNTLALSLVVQVANVGLVWLVGRAIGAPVPAAYYCILVPMVSLLTLLPVSLNGMGIREGGTVLFLAPLGIGAGTALSVAFLWFAVGTVASLGGGCVYLFGRFPRPTEGTPEIQSAECGMQNAA